MRENMTSEHDVLKTRAVQVGFVMRSYREAFLREDGRRGLTQEELLKRMGQVDDTYAQRFSHATVSRWETGATRPTAGWIKVFGDALGLSETEIAGLILLGGLAPDFKAAGHAIANGENELSEHPPFTDWHNGQQAIETAKDGLNPLRELSGFLALKCLPLGLLIAGLGYALSFLDWGVAWTPVAYTGLVVALVLAVGFVFPNSAVPMREFFWVSLFLLLSTPLMQFAPILMDHYNFYNIGNFAGTHIPYTLALLLNLILASAAAVMYHLLWRWQYNGDGFRHNAFKRAAWVVIPPAAFVYAVIVVITNVSISIQMAILIPVLTLLFAALLLLRDPSLKPSERDQQILFPAAVAGTIVATIVGIAIIFSIYISPNHPMVLPDHNLLASWEINFQELGYDREEALDRLNLGYAWHSMSVLVYILFVVGGRVLAGIYLMGSNPGSTPAPQVGNRSTQAAEDPLRERESLAFEGN